MGQICFFNTAKAWGGGEKWHFEISNYLYEKGHDVFVIAHKESELLKRLMKAEIPCKGIAISNLSFLNPFKYFNLISFFRKSNIDTIVMNLSRDVKIAGPSAQKSGVKRIIYRRGSAIPIKNTLLNRYYFKHIVTEILANSFATKNTVTQNNDTLFPKEKITVIYNGIRTKSITDIDVLQENKDFTIINLGRLEYQKNQKFLIHLAALLKERKIPFKLIIGGEGSLRRELEKLIVELNVQGHVSLEGFIERPLEFIKRADIFVLPSFWEGFGYVLAEAALCHKPIVAFDVSSNPELILDDTTGYLVEVNDLNTFADKIIGLYQNHELRKRMGEKGHVHIKTNFDKDAQLKKIEDYLVYG